ncbi:hypothetical protein [Tsukamurella spumae]|uniref:Uncharacterized protein n=1 Tax=Tsukamurella spumae TaxID=44753 RepID=A0A846X505_9ACTN|nr:hypothetical protein [Tsukamurella spumae]NKY20203.1 hypothetical protein [Tsukamurella spumae]
MTNDDTGSAPAENNGRSILALLFDIRAIIATLLGIYGVLLLVAGLAPGFAEAGAREFQHTPDRADLSAGSASNLWVGGALVLVSAAFAAWALIGSRRAGS